MPKVILNPSGELIASARFGEEPGVPTDYYFYNYDKRGSTTAILQPDGTLKKGYEYDEFGNLEQSGDADFLNDVTFNGSVSDMSTGMQYMNARYYNPTTGRFLSQDTYSGNAYEPWTQNLYSYCGNNPTNFVDPTGHMRDERGGACKPKISYADYLRLKYEQERRIAEYQAANAGRKPVLQDPKPSIKPKPSAKPKKSSSSGGSSGTTSSGSNSPLIGFTDSVITTSDTVEPVVYPQGPGGILGDVTIRNTQSIVTTMGSEGTINFGSYSRNETTVGLTAKVGGLKADVSASWEQVSAKAGISIGDSSYTIGAGIDSDPLGVSSISFTTSNTINVNGQVSTVNSTTYSYEAPTLLVVAVAVVAAPVVAAVGVGAAVVEGVGSFFGWIFGTA